jgi:hypothetical protein
LFVLQVAVILCFLRFLCETKTFIPEAVNVNVNVNVTAQTVPLTVAEQLSPKLSFFHRTTGAFTMPQAFSPQL